MEVSLSELDSYKTACVIAGILEEKLAKDIVILNISKISVMADYFVICSTETTTQLRAVSEIILKELKDKFNRSPKNEGRDTVGKWYLFDYGDVILHVLHKEAREYYAIEKFWSHAFVVEDNDWQLEYKQSYKK